MSDSPYQGKRRNQVRFSEAVGAFCLVMALLIIFAVIFVDGVNRQLDVWDAQAEAFQTSLVGK